MDTFYTKYINPPKIYWWNFIPAGVLPSILNMVAFFTILISVIAIQFNIGIIMGLFSSGIGIPAIVIINLSTWFLGAFLYFGITGIQIYNFVNKLSI